MKKFILPVLILLVVALTCIYLFIPSRVRISAQRQTGINKDALFRQLGSDTAWKNWWPGEIEKNDSGTIFLLHGIQYHPLPNKALSVPVVIAAKDQSVVGDLLLLSQHPDEVQMEFSATWKIPVHPIKRVAGYFTAKRLKQDIASILQAAAEYYGQTINLYGYDIRKERVADSILLMNSRTMNRKPTTDDIYTLVDELRVYIKQQSAKETGYPMLNIFTKDSIDYILKVAIPVNKQLPPSGNMAYRWMLGGGNILITEVKGDDREIQKAYNQVLNYVSDNNRIAPAIHFESLVTDRRRQRDSTQWITRICYPVM